MKGSSHGPFQHHPAGKQAALGAGMFGGSGVVAVYGVGCLLACAIIAISGVVADIEEIKERAHR